MKSNAKGGDKSPNPLLTGAREVDQTGTDGDNYTRQLPGFRDYIIDHRIQTPGFGGKSWIILQKIYGRRSSESILLPSELRPVHSDVVSLLDIEL